MIKKNNLRNCSLKQWFIQTTVEATTNSLLQPLQNTLTLAQTQDFSNPGYQAPINYFYDCIQNNNMGFLYRGWQITFVLTFMKNIYKRYEVKKYENSRKYYKRLFVYFLISYPLKVISIRFQQDVIGQFKSVQNCAKQILERHQVHGIYRGFISNFVMTDLSYVILAYSNQLYNLLFPTIGSQLTYILYQLDIGLVNNIRETLNKVMISGLVRQNKELFSKAFETIIHMVQHGGLMNFSRTLVNRLFKKMIERKVIRLIYK